ncbi:MAG: hypothetical protein ACFFD1_01030 [Candidatus Thorarchaeota archaeon]
MRRTMRLIYCVTDENRPGNHIRSFELEKHFAVCDRCGAEQLIVDPFLKDLTPAGWADYYEREGRLLFHRLSCPACTTKEEPA